MQYRTLLKKEELEGVLYEIYISDDESRITVRVSQAENTVSKDFPNNVFGLSKLEEFKQRLNSIEKLKSYLGV